MKQNLRFLLLALLCAVFSTTWGEETPYKTQIFDSSTGNGASGYTNNWTNTYENFACTIVNFNNNNWNQWTWIKCGPCDRNKGILESTASITTNAVIDKAITKVVVNVGSLANGTVESAILKVATDAEFTKNLQTISEPITETGDVTYIVTTPLQNCYYELSFTVKNTTKKNGVLQINRVDYYADSSGDQPQPTVATPVFSPNGGEFTSEQSVTITCETPGVSIYYTTDGSDPTSSSTLYEEPFTISETTTVKAIAILADDTSEIAEAIYTLTNPPGEYDINFENETLAYSKWTFTNITSNYSNNGVTAHGGSKYGSTGGKESGSITTKEKVATPNTLTCYVSKQSTNTTASTWYIQVSGDRSTWTDVASISASSMTMGEWKELTADLSNYSDVYVRVYYSGTTAIRLIDDLTFNTDAPAVAKPVFSLPGGDYAGTQSVSITCETDGANIYYTINGDEPDNTSTAYTGEITISETTTLKAIAYVGTDHSKVTSATYNITPVLTISEVRTQNTGNAVCTQGIVTSISGTDRKTVYIQDEDAAICVFGTITNINIGDKILVQGTLTNYNGLLEITNPTCTVISQNNEVTPEVMNIAEVNSSTNQGWLVKIENATVTEISNQNTTIAQGENTIVVRGITGVNLIEGDIITLTGNIGCYNNNPQIANPTNVTIKADKYYVAGSWTSWETGMIEMTRSADGTYTLANQELAAEAEFKIVKVSDESTVWYRGEGNDNYWITADNHTNISLITSDGPNFYMPIAGTWTFTVDPTGNTPTLTVDGNWPVLEYYLVGSFNNWTTSDSYKFQKDEGTSKYTLSKTIEQGEEFKIIDSDGTWYGAVSDGNFYVEANTVNIDISLTTSNVGQNFYMNLSNKSEWHLDFDPDNNKLKITNFVSDVAELPFKFDGKKDDVKNTSGLTESGLGSDYGSSPKLKFDSTDDALVLHFNGRPGILTFNIKGNPGSGTITTSVFEVQTSVDGETWTTLKTYENIPNTLQSEAFDNIGENVRYIKWILTEKKSGNVALGKIELGKYTTPITATFNHKYKGFTSIYYADKNLKVPADVTAHTYKVVNGKGEYINNIPAGGVIPAGTPVILEYGKSFTEAVTVTFEEVESAEPLNDGNMLRGSDDVDSNGLTTAPGNGNQADYYYYVLSVGKSSENANKIGFYWKLEYGRPFTPTPHKIYLALLKSEVDANNASIISIYDSDGIDSIAASDYTTQDVYSLSGVRMNGKDLPKGIYIIGGKKVVIK